MDQTEVFQTFLESVSAFFRKVGGDIDPIGIIKKTELLLQQSNQDSIQLLSNLLSALQNVLLFLQEEKGNVTRVSFETKDLRESTNSEETKPKSKAKLDQHLVQITADKSEIERRISAFIERKRKDVDDTNVREFCGLFRPNVEGHSCARTDAVFIPRADSKSHVKVSKVENVYGPQTRVLDTTSEGVGRGLPGVKQEAGTSAGSDLTGVEERLQNMEHHVQIAADSKDVFQRVKALEERILYLESLSPEYFTVSTNKRGRTPGDRPCHKRQYGHHAQIPEKSNIEDKIQQLKAKILAKKIKQDPG